MIRVMTGIRVLHTNFFRTKSNIVVLVCSWLYCSLVYLLLMEENDPLAMIHNSFYGQSLAMLLFIFLGLSISQYEENNNFYGFNTMLYYTKYQFNIVKAVFVLIITSQFSMSLFLSNSLAFMHMKMPLRMFIYSIKMLVLHYSLPVFSSGVLGLVIGLSIKSRAKYVIAIIIWIVTCPLSINFSSYISELVGTAIPNLSYFFSIINLSALMQTGPTPMYGITFQPYYFILSLSKAFYLLTGLFLVSLFQEWRKEQKWPLVLLNCSLIVVIVVVSIASFSRDTYKLHVFSSIPEVMRTPYDSDYYYTEYYDGGILLSPNAMPSFEQQRKMTVRKYDILLDIQLTKMEVICNIEAVADTKISTQSFTLYRDFDLKSIMVNNETIEFMKEGDYIDLHFAKPISDGEVFNLQFIYTGTSSPIFPANSGAVYLSACFPWLPEPGMRMPLSYSPYSSTDMFTIYSGAKSENEIEYELDFKSPYETYVNLNRINSSTWRGISNDGLSVYSDYLMECAEINSVTVYYPSAIKSKLDIILPICINSGEMYREIQGILGEETNQVYDCILVLPILPTIQYQGVVRNYVMHNNLMLYFETPFFLEGYMGRYPSNLSLTIGTIRDENALYDAVFALINQPRITMSTTSEPINRLFLPCIVQWYAKKHSIELNVNTPWVSITKAIDQYISKETNYSVVDYEIVNQIEYRYQELLQHNELGAEKFLALWYTKLKEPTAPTLMDIHFLLDGIN